MSTNPITPEAHEQGWAQTSPMVAYDEPFIDSEPTQDIHVMDYVRLIWARRWIVIGIAVATVVLATAWGKTRTELFRATSEISVGEQSAQIIKNQISFGPNYWELERYVEEQLRVLKTKRLTRRVAEKLGLDSHPKFAGRDAGIALLGMLNVERVPETNMVLVNLTTRNPQQAAEWLNVLVDEYIAMNIEDNLQRTRKIYEVIQSKLDPLRSQLAESEASLVTFRERESSILFSSHEKNVITEQIDTLTTEYAHTKAERISLETKISALRRIQAADLAEVTFPEVMTDPTIGRLREQKGNIEMELSEKSGSLREGHPEMKDLRSRLAGINELIQAQIATLTSALQTDYEIVNDREQSLFSNLQQLKNQSVELSRQTLEFNRLEREYDQNKAFLEEMLARSKEADISSTASVNNIRIIEPAEAPRGPFTPNMPRIVTLSIVLGLFFGVGLVLGLDFLDQTIRSPDQAERVLGLDVLGLVPEMREGMDSAAREAVQTLRTAVMMASKSEGGQVLMITSAIPGEGKTTVASELAKTLTRAGSKVLLIDADLRKPRIHRLLQTKNTSGLTTVMLGEVDIDTVKHHLNDPAGLDVVTTGPLPPNPPELFAKPSFKAMLDQSRSEYEWIVIDSPPIASVTDPVICAAHADMALMVVRYAGARHTIIRTAIRQLSRSGVQIAGVLLNRFDITREHSYSQYSYYRYTYQDY